MSDFAHLHLHTEYSLLDGACRIKDIPAAAKAAGHTAVAITDHGVMYGAVEFYNACKKEGIKPIIGCEIYLSPRSRFDKTYSADSDFSHLVLLCENETGYRNLIKIVSKSFTEGFYIKPRADIELLKEHHEGLIALSACLSGRIAKLIAQTNMAEAKATAMELSAIFGKDNFYLELQDHGIAVQKQVNAGLITLSEQTGIPLVATNDVHYLRRGDADIQTVMMCIQTNTKLSDGKPVGFETNEFYYKSTEEMLALFPGHTEAVANAAKIAERCNFDFTFGKYYLPAFTTPDGSESADYLRRMAYKGLDERIANGDIIFENGRQRADYVQRIEYELSVIVGMGYAEYYLIVSDFVRYAKSHGIPVGPGRGSGAGSLIAYLVYITEVDSLRYGLLFERFLNPERISMPDFDIDFCYIRRGEVIQYVSDKYGEDRVSQIIAFGTLAANAAVRDAGRAMGMAYSDVDAVAKAIPKQLGITLSDAVTKKPLKEMVEGSPEIGRLIATAKALEGMPHHASTHAAGVVISDRPVSDYVPLAVNRNIPITQYDMDTVASLGLLKFDFLGLRYLTVISDTEAQIKESVPDFSVKSIDEQDEATFEMLSSGKSDGVFQLESAGMRQMLTEFRPRSIHDIMIVNALYRPGPMEAIPKVLENRRGKPVVYEIPELADILDSTYGCVVYQEQVMEIFRRLAGYSLGKADVVRKAISKKHPEVIKAQREDFLNGCELRGIDRGKAGRLFDELVSFAGYAFNKSHAAAYAILSYRSAYLKCHYPAQYISAIMTSEFGNHGKLARYTDEAARLGISLLAPSVNESMTDFHVDSTGKNIRYGLLALKNVGLSFVDKVIEDRTRKGLFKSFPDFVERLYGADMNKRQIEAMIKAGAFDGLDAHRSQLLACYEEIIDRIVDRQRGNVEGQLNLFTQLGESADDGYEYPSIPELSLRELLALEKEASGMYFSGHLTDEYSENAEDLGAVPICDILASFDEEAESSEYREKQSVAITGLITEKTVKQTKNGEAMAFISLEDKHGEIECVLFPKIYEEFSPLIITDAIIAAYGEISVRDDEPPKLLLRAVAPMRPNGVYTHRPSPFSALANPSSEARKPTAYSQNHTATTPIYRTEASPVGGTADTYTAPKAAPFSKIYLRISNSDERALNRAVSLFGIFEPEQAEPKADVIFFDTESGKYTHHPELSCQPLPIVIHTLKELFGEDNVATR